MGGVGRVAIEPVGTMLTIQEGQEGLNSYNNIIQ